MPGGCFRHQSKHFNYLKKLSPTEARLNRADDQCDIALMGQLVMKGRQAMTTSPFARLGLALILFTCLDAGLPQADAQGVSLARGDAVVTGFSASNP
jgi:hypothetical protein